MVAVCNERLRYDGEQLTYAKAGLLTCNWDCP